MADTNKKYLDQTGLARLVANMDVAYAKAEHEHTVADITDLTATATELNYMDGVTSNVQTQLNNKAASSHTHSAYVNQNAFSNVKVGDVTVAADSATDTLTLTAGSNVTLTADASGDSITIAAKDTTYSTATTSANGLMSSGDKSKLDNIAAGAQVNQNAFSNVVVGSTTIAADSATDSITFVAGSNVTLTPDATNDKLTIAAKDTTYSAATTSAAGLMSAADKTKLDGIATGANKYTLPVAGSSLGGVKSGTDITVDSSGNVSVNNDSHSHSASTITSVNASAITGVIDAANLPSYVDDVIEGYYSSSKFYKEAAHTTEIAGESGKIYVDLDSNKTYRWSGSAFVVISETLALGETSSTAYRGDRGATAYTHATSDTGKALTSGLYKITTSSRGHVTAGTAVAKADITALGIPAQDTTYSDATQSVHGLMSTADKIKLDGIATGANNYSLPLATSSVRGGVKIGYTQSGKNYPVQLSNEQMYVNVPWSDTHYASKNVVGSSTATSNTTTALTNGNVYINSVENGAVTSAHKISGTNGVTVTTDTSGNIAVNHTTSAGYKHIPSGGAAGQILEWSASGTAVWADIDTISDSEIDALFGVTA